MPRPSPIVSESAKSWGDLVTLTVDRVSTTVEEMHHAIARPWFRLAGPAAQQLRSTHDAATSAVYRSVRAITRAAGRISDLVHGDSESERTSDAVQAFANAVWGDELARRSSSMAIQMAVRDRTGAVVELDPGRVAEAFPAATGRLVVLLHGLGQTERCFGETDTSPGLIDTLAASSVTPVPVRYNSGNSVLENGRSLARLLDELNASWPVPVTAIELVGYSMGGLIARSAIDAGRSGAGRWIEFVRHVVTIATPHDGSPIEKAVEAASRALMLAPQTRPLAGFLAQRSAGIRDLHSGVDLPWAFDGVEHHVVAAVMTSADSKLGPLIGDLVVRPSSAIGRPRLLVDNHAVIGGRRHHEILDDPSLAEQIIGWIDRGRVHQNR